MKKKILKYLDVINTWTTDFDFNKFVLFSNIDFKLTETGCTKYFSEILMCLPLKDSNMIFLKNIYLKKKKLIISGQEMYPKSQNDSNI